MKIVLTEKFFKTSFKNFSVKTIISEIFLVLHIRKIVKLFTFNTNLLVMKIIL